MSDLPQEAAVASVQETVSSSEPSASNTEVILDSVSGSVILEDLSVLLKRAKNFNIHMNVLKRLLNLKDPDEGYAFADTTAEGLKEDLVKKEFTTSSLTSKEIVKIHDKMTQFQKEVEESQALSFCLAFNVQRLQKLLTGLALDADAADDVVRDLWKKFNESKTKECILKYEFEEKRRLLKRLRRELEQARRDWKNLKIRISAPSEDPIVQGNNGRHNSLIKSNSSSSEDTEWSEGREQNRGNIDSAVHSDEGEESSSSEIMNILETRSQQLDGLERECLQFVTQMITRDPESTSVSVPDDDNELSMERMESEAEGFHSPMPIPVELLVQVLATDEEDFDEDDEDGSPLIDDEEYGEDDVDFDSEEGRVLSSVDSVNEMSSSLMTTTASSSSQLTLLTPEISAGVTDVANEGLNTLSTPATTQSMLSQLMRSEASSRSSRTDDEDDEDTRRLREESLAETGEPLVLCRLRRRAVEVLVSRLREEKAFHESREKELEQKLSESIRVNQQLRQELLSLPGNNKTDGNSSRFLDSCLSSHLGSLSSPSSSISQANGRTFFCLGVGVALLAVNAFYGVKMLS